MILEFSVKNFLSFKDLATFSMIGVKSFKEFEETHTIKVDSELKVLKSSAIYGNNASGKSNFLYALSFLKYNVINSFRDALTDNGEKKSPLEKFKLNSDTENLPSFFEIVFIHNNRKYRYGFEIDYDIIVSEWLFHTTTKEVLLFKRENDTIAVNKSAFKEGVGFKARPNVLFLTAVATNNKGLSDELISWFKKINIITSIDDNHYKLYTIKKLNSDKNFHQWASRFVKYLEISNLTIIAEDINVDNLNGNSKELKELSERIEKLNKKSQIDHGKIITWHRKFDKNNILIDTIPFDFDSLESEGTKKLIYLLGPFYDTLRNGKTLIIDEIDSRLHSSLTTRIVELFHLYNKKNAQLIFATHDISILNKEIFRRDQIWFIEKDQFGASEMYSLADFKSEKVRNKSAFDKNYIEGKYGAIPYLEFDDKLIQLLYGEE